MKPEIKFNTANKYEPGEIVSLAMDHYESALKLGYVKDSHDGPYLIDGEIVMIIVPPRNEFLKKLLNFEL